MRLLLDTHVFIWWLDRKPITGSAHAAISDGTSQVFISAVTPWEIAIKKNLGRLNAPDDLSDQLVSHRFVPLDITHAHALAAGSLPLHHRDPFDRFLVAQANLEGLTLVTRDPLFERYDVRVLAA